VEFGYLNEKKHQFGFITRIYINWQTNLLFQCIQKSLQALQNLKKSSSLGDKNVTPDSPQFLIVTEAAKSEEPTTGNSNQRHLTAFKYNKKARSKPVK